VDPLEAQKILLLLAVADSEVRAYEVRLAESANDVQNALRKAVEMIGGTDARGSSTGVLKHWGPELDVNVGKLCVARDWRDRIRKVCDDLGV
jgi:hypothetical protein